MVTTAGAHQLELEMVPESPSESPTWMKEPVYLGHLTMPFKAISRQQDQKVMHACFRLVPVWDADITSKALTHYSTLALYSFTERVESNIEVKINKNIV